MEVILRDEIETLVRRLRIVVALLDLAANAGFLLKLHDRQEEVDVEMHYGVKAIDELQMFGRSITVVANSAAHDGPVFLLDIGIVILLSRPAGNKLPKLYIDTGALPTLAELPNSSSSIFICKDEGR